MNQSPLKAFAVRARADGVACSWFLRIVALRLLDAHGHNGFGVVSPGTAGGRPEVLVRAERGEIDRDVVGDEVAAAVAGLLDGTRTADDPQEEAYALLLGAYCRHWSGRIPLFRQEDGFVPGGLLAEGSVLQEAVRVLTDEVCADVGVAGWLYQHYSTERRERVFAGFARGRKAGAAEIPAATQLYTPDWIARYLVQNSLGRLWMQNRPGSRLAERMEYFVAPAEGDTGFARIDSAEELRILDPACGAGHLLLHAYDLLQAIYEEEGYAAAEIPRLALGNLRGIEIDSRAAELAAFALGLRAGDLDGPQMVVLLPDRFDAEELGTLRTPDGDREAETAFWNRFEQADLLGALIRPDPALIGPLRAHLDDLAPGPLVRRARRVLDQAEYLRPGYHVVVANPPYMGSRNMTPALVTWAQNAYPVSRSDLFAMFVERSCELTRPGGAAALITRDAWMFLSRFTEFRRRLTACAEIASMAHLGTGVFEGATSGAVVQVAAFVLAVRPPRFPGVYVRLAGEGAAAARRDALRQAVRSGRPDLTYVVDQRTFAALPGTPIAYWASAALRRAFESGRIVEDVAPVRQGFQTGDNDRFMRFWWEVPPASIKRDATSTADFHASGARFAPYLKGGGFRKWFGNDEYVVAFDEAAYARLAVSGNRLPSRGRYFTDGITWSALASGDLGARHAGPGHTFSAKGACAFPVDEFSRDLVLAVLNSSVARELLTFMGATIDFNVGSLRQLPLPAGWSDEAAKVVTSAVPELVDLHRTDRNTDETAPGFAGSDLLGAGDSPLLAERVEVNHARWMGVTRRVSDVQTALDATVAEAYGLQGLADLPVTLRNVPGPDFARRQVLDLVSYAVGCMLGRYRLDGHTPVADGVLPMVDLGADDVVERFRGFLGAAFGDRDTEENLRFVAASLGVRDLRDYVRRSFYRDHVQRYSRRPVYWLFSSPQGSFTALVAIHRYVPSTAFAVLDRLREYRTRLCGSEAEGRLGAELDAYERDVLGPLAERRIALDLHEGVRANHARLGPALRPVPGLPAKVRGG